MMSSGLNVGFVYSGVSYQHRFITAPENSERLTILNSWELECYELPDYDLLVVPRGSDQEALYASRNDFRGYLDNGGAVASFGEFTEQWLPDVTWDGVLPSDDGPLVIVAEHPLVRDIVAVDLHWHKGATGWCCHGHFKEPGNAEVLVRTEAGDPVLYIDTTTTQGTIIASSQVDIVCHAAHGRAAAQRIFDNMLEWVEDRV